MSVIGTWGSEVPEWLVSVTKGSEGPVAGARAMMCATNKESKGFQGGAGCHLSRSVKKKLRGIIV